MSKVQFSVGVLLSSCEKTTKCRSLYCDPKNISKGSLNIGTFAIKANKIAVLSDGWQARHTRTAFGQLC